MTREQEILHASKQHKNALFDNYGDAFIAGAIWADEHSKSPWISVKDDLPCNHKELTHSNYTDRVLVISRNGYPEVAFMCLIGDSWEWNTFIKVLYWMPIPEPPKE